MYLNVIMAYLANLAQEKCWFCLRTCAYVAINFLQAYSLDSHSLILSGKAKVNRIYSTVGERKLRAE